MRQSMLHGIQLSLCSSALQLWYVLHYATPKLQRLGASAAVTCGQGVHMQARMRNTCDKLHCHRRK